jgi:phosphate transport system permease protein
MAVGASKMQIVLHHILPLSIPGVMTGTILAVSRAIGETAPLIAIGALTYIAFLPQSLSDPFTVLNIQIFNWISRPQKGFFANAAAGIIVLLCLTLIMNTAAILLRHRYQKKIRW